MAELLIASQVHIAGMISRFGGVQVMNTENLTEDNNESRVRTLPRSKLVEHLCCTPRHERDWNSQL